MGGSTQKSFDMTLGHDDVITSYPLMASTQNHLLFIICNIAEGY